MATESYGRCDDGVHWAVYHELPLGQWWWMIRPEGGERVDSPRRYPTEGQALAAVEAARAAVVAGRPVVGTMESLRARAEAAEARAAQAEAAGYRRAIDEACVALGKRAGYLRNFDLAEEIVRALAPVEPVSPADGLPGGAA